MSKTQLSEATNKAERKVRLTCIKCGRRTWENKAKDWRTSTDGAVCGDCIGAAHYVATVTVPILGPATPAQNDWLNKTIGAQGRCPLWDWKSLKDALGVLWTNSCHAKNYIYREYMRNDPAIPGDKPAKFVISPELGRAIYAGVKENYGEFSGGAISQMMQIVRQRYATDRFDLWRGKRSASMFTGWQPYHVREKDLQFGRLLDGQLAVRVVFGPKGEQSNSAWLILKGSLTETREAVKHQRAIETLRKCAAGEWSYGAGMLTAREDCDQDGKRKVDVLLRLAVEFPIEQKAASRRKALYVATANAGFLYARFAKSPNVWFSNQDHMKGREEVLRHVRAKHNRLMERLRQDTKAERRGLGRSDRLVAKKERLSLVNANRAKTFIQQQAASVSGYAARNGVTDVIYDDTAHGYFGDGFEYHAFKTTLQHDLRKHGINMQTPDAWAEAQALLSQKKGADREEFRKKSLAEQMAIIAQLRDEANGGAAE